MRISPNDPLAALAKPAVIRPTQNTPSAIDTAPMEWAEMLYRGDAPSTPNLREHWSARAKRAKQQRAQGKKMGQTLVTCLTGPLVEITLTRIGKRRLDDDNWVASGKATRDGVADALRIDDASPLVRWSYAQRKPEPGEEPGIEIGWKRLEWP